MEPRRFEAYLRRHHPDQAEAGQVREEIAKVREMHVGFNIGGSIEGHIGIASSVIIRDFPVTVAISLAGPRSRMEDHVDEMAQNLRETAEALSRTSPLE